MRLSSKAVVNSRRSREQEVLHYRWFADLGNSDAARALGQMLSHGALRDPEQALRYFRCGRRKSQDNYDPSACQSRRQLDKWHQSQVWEGRRQSLSSTRLVTVT